MKRSLLLLLFFVLGVATMVAVSMTPPTGPHDPTHINQKPLEPLVPGAGQDNYIIVWDNALDTWKLEAQTGGGGGLTNWSDGKDNDTATFTPINGNTFGGFTADLTMQGNDIIGVDSIDVTRIWGDSATFGTRARSNEPLPPADSVIVFIADALNDQKAQTAGLFVAMYYTGEGGPIPKEQLGIYSRSQTLVSAGDTISIVSIKGIARAEGEGHHFTIIGGDFTAKTGGLDKGTAGNVIGVRTRSHILDSATITTLVSLSAEAPFSTDGGHAVIAAAIQAIQPDDTSFVNKFAILLRNRTNTIHEPLTIGFLDTTDAYHRFSYDATEGRFEVDAILQVDSTLRIVDPDNADGEILKVEFWDSTGAVEFLGWEPVSDRFQFSDDLTIGGALWVNGNHMRLMSSGGDGDQFIYFYEDGNSLGRFLKWNDATNLFLFNDGLDVEGDLRVDSNLTINADDGANDAIITFTNPTSDGIINYDHANQQFELNHQLLVTGTIRSTSAVYLGTSGLVQSPALFAFESGSSSGASLTYDSLANDWTFSHDLDFDGNFALNLGVREGQGGLNSTAWINQGQILTRTFGIANYSVFQGTVDDTLWWKIATLPESNASTGDHLSIDFYYAEARWYDRFFMKVEFGNRDGFNGDIVTLRDSLDLRERGGIQCFNSGAGTAVDVYLVIIGTANFAGAQLQLTSYGWGDQATFVLPSAFDSTETNPIGAKTLVYNTLDPTVVPSTLVRFGELFAYGDLTADAGFYTDSVVINLPTGSRLQDGFVINSNDGGNLRMINNTSTVDAMAAGVFGKATHVTAPGLTIQGETSIDDGSTSASVTIRAKDPDDQSAIDAGDVFEVLNWTTALLTIDFSGIVDFHDNDLIGVDDITMGDGASGVPTLILQGTDPIIRLEANSGNPSIMFQDAGGDKMSLAWEAGNSRFVIRAPGTQDRIRIAGSGEITFNEAYTFPTSAGSVDQILKIDGSGNLTFQNDQGAGSGDDARVDTLPGNPIWDLPSPYWLRPGTNVTMNRSATGDTLYINATGGGGLAFFDETDDADTSVLAASVSSGNTTVGFNDLLTMQGNDIIGIDSIDVTNVIRMADFILKINGVDYTYSELDNPIDGDVLTLNTGPKTLNWQSDAVGSDTSLFLADVVGTGVVTLQIESDSLLFLDGTGLDTLFNVYGSVPGDTTYWTREDIGSDFFMFLPNVMFDGPVFFNQILLLEGSTKDGFEQLISTIDPTADRNFNFPDDELRSGDVLVSGANQRMDYVAMPSAQILIGQGTSIPAVHALTGDVFISNTGVTTIQADAVQEPDLDITNAGSVGNVLQKAAGNQFTWAAAGSDSSLFLTEAVGTGTRTVFWSNDTLFFRIGNDTIMRLTDNGTVTELNAFDNTNGFLFSSTITLSTGGLIDVTGGRIINVFALESDSLYAITGNILVNSPLDLNSNDIIGVGQIGGEYGFKILLDTGYVTIESSDTVGTIPGSARLVIKAGNVGDAMLHFIEVDNGWNIRHRASDNAFVFSELLGGSERLKITSAGAVTFNDAFTFPTADGSANQVLETDGAGNLTFEDPTGGSSLWATFSTSDTIGYVATDTFISIRNNGALTEFSAKDNLYFRFLDSIDMTDNSLMNVRRIRFQDTIRFYQSGEYLLSISDDAFITEFKTENSGGFAFDGDVTFNDNALFGVASLQRTSGAIAVFNDLDLNSNHIIGIDSLHADKYKDNSIQESDLDISNTGVIGNILYKASGDQFTYLTPNGTAGLFLKSGGVGVAPSWDTPAGSGLWVTKNSSDSIAVIGTDTLIIITRNSTTNASIIKVGESDGSLKILADTVGKPGGTTTIGNELNLDNNDIIQIDSMDAGTGFFDRLYANPASGDRLLMPRVAAATTGHVLKVDITPSGYDSTYWATDNSAGSPTLATIFPLFHSAYFDSTQGASPDSMIIKLATATTVGVASFSTDDFFVSGAGLVSIGAGLINSNEIENNSVNLPDIQNADDLSTQTVAYVNDEAWWAVGGILFEGATGGGDNNELLLTVQDPASDITVTIQNITGTLALQGGETWTGVHDFGGATSLEIPNATNPAATLVGHIFFDTDDSALAIFDGAREVLVPVHFTKEFIIWDPETIDDTIPILEVDSMIAQAGITLESFSATTNLDGTYTLNLYEFTGDDPPVRVGAGTIATLGFAALDQRDATQTFSDDGIGRGNMVYILTPSTDIDWVKVKIRYYINAND